MLASLGEITVYVSFIALIAAAVMYFLNWRGVIHDLRIARLAFFTAVGALLLGVVILFTAIFTHDFSIEYVAKYSSRDLPLIYLVSAFWAGQMGTFLLWAAMLGVCGLVVMRRKEKLDSGVMALLAIITLSIVAIFLKRSPFAILAMVPPDGNGLNPLLQDFWMAIHPPIMFVGFAAAAVPFAYAIVALFSGQHDKWEARARSWTLLSWLTIGLSLMLGGYWAYKVLGWGGWWAWDPVENSSLIPWLFLTAQLHVLVIRRNRSGLSRFSPMLVSLTFLSIVYGTFLTRSGVLQDFSVHSFVDLGLNGFLIASLSFFTLLTVLAFATRWTSIKSEPSYTSVSSTAYMLTIGAVIVFIGAFLTLGGMSAPLLTRFTANPSAVEMSYYTLTMTPIALLTLIILALFPFFKWNSGISDRIGLFFGLAFFLVCAVATKFVFAVESWWYTALISAGFWAVYSNLYQLRKVIMVGRFPSAPLVHIGLALILVGATTSAGLEEKESVVLTQGEAQEVLGHNLVYTGYIPDGADTSFTLDVREIGEEGNSFVASMAHRNPNPNDGMIKNPHIEKGFLRDIYFSPLGSEIARGAGPVVVELVEGEVARVGEYHVEFAKRETVRKDETSPATKLICVLEITKMDMIEHLHPAMEMVGGGIQLSTATLEDGSGSVTLLMERAERGGMLFSFDGVFSSGTAIEKSVLAVEVSIKPLISLVWLGSILLFGAGGVAYWLAARRPEDELHSRHLLDHEAGDSTGDSADDSAREA